MKRFFNVKDENMKEIELVHFIEWKKLSDEAFEPTLKDAAAWGIKQLVAHPCWGMKDETNGAYMENCGALLGKYGFSTFAYTRPKLGSLRYRNDKILSVQI